MIQCPKCQHPLSEQDIKDIPFEYTSLVLCAYCGFGMDLRWQGRTSNIETTADVMISGLDEGFIQQFQQSLPPISIKYLPSYQDALHLYARALRRGEHRKIKSIILQKPSAYASWTEIILSFYSLQRAFAVSDPLYLWIFAPMTSNATEISMLEALRPQTLCWFPCESGSETQHILAHVPDFVKKLI